MSSSSPSVFERTRDAVSAVRGGGRGWTLLAIAGGWFFVLGLRFVVPALLPSITGEFAVSNAAAGGAITLLWLTYGLMQFPAGALIGRLGERRLLAGSALASALALAGYVISPTFAVFLLATALFGFASGVYGSPRGTVLARTFPERDGFAFGVVLAAGSLGAALLPVVATVVDTAFDWRAALGVSIPGFLVFAGALWVAVPRAGDTTTDGGEPTDRRSLATAVFRAIRDWRISLAFAGISLMLFVFQGVTAFFTTYLVEAKSLSEGTAGILFGLLFVAGAVSQSASGGLADRYGHGPVMAAVALVGTLPLLALPFLSGLFPLAVASVLVGVRLGVAPVSNAYMVSELTPQVRGTAWGLLRTAFFILGSFGSTVVGAMADADRFAEAFFVLAGVSLVAFLIYLFLPARTSDGERAAD